MRGVGPAGAQSFVTPDPNSDGSQTDHCGRHFKCHTGPSLISVLWIVALGIVAVQVALGIGPLGIVALGREKCKHLILKFEVLQ